MRDGRNSVSVNIILLQKEWARPAPFVSDNAPFWGDVLMNAGCEYGLSFVRFVYINLLKFSLFYAIM